MAPSPITSASPWSEFVRSIGGRRLLGSYAILLVAIGLAWGPIEVSRGGPPSTAALLSAFIVAPGLIILFGAYRLPRTNIRPEFYPAILNRCLGGFALMALIVGIYHFQPAESLGEPFTLLFVLGSLASVAGYRVGISHARSMELQRTQDQLNETVDRLETSNELLDQFAYAASHDLQEPLRMVSSHLLLIEKRHGDEFDEEASEYLEFAVERSNRMRDMIDGLLEYSRIETADEPFESVDLETVVDDVRGDIELQVEEADADITVDDLPQVYGDASQLHQVFQNLLTNAIEYSGEEPPEIDISATRTDGWWTISVQDRGIGIHPDEADRVFEVFERLQTHQGGDGTGIGLTICQRIVDRHGGDIWVNSMSGEGSTFSFTLPASGGVSRE